ncbi:MAG TPA: carboxypeptidase regulatory-like domain-containing protein, partial [Fibrella sp.]
MLRYLLLFFFLLPVTLLAQRTASKNGVIKGLVIDSTSQKALLEANVSLLNARDSSFVQVQSTGGEGDFTLSSIAPGTYRLLVSFVGYRTKIIPVTITAERPEVVLGTVLIQPQTQNLGEVVIVQERPPVSVKGDTVEFNAGSFKTQPNAQVEDLIKKLPGMEVDRDGNVKAQGQDVRRVLVDGKPFFGNDPKMATRNLPADMIERVQVFDRQSDQSQFSGVDDGERDRTINLVTKRDRRRGVFGQEAVGY